MARISFLLGLTTCLLTLLPSTIGVEIHEIFTLPRTGTTNGGCGDRMNVLDQWLGESIRSVGVALDAINDYDNDARVRKSMAKFFRIHNGGKLPETGIRVDAVQEVKDNLQYVEDFLNHETIGETADFIYNSDNYWLFCHSNFLVAHGNTDPALDYEADIILDEDGNQVRIGDIPEYVAQLEKEPNAIPWWAGSSGLNGYYFTETGGNFCNGDNLGLTASIQPLQRNANNQAEEDDLLASVILCPHAFDGSKRPNNYREANSLLREGINLADAVPKSATLLHELFHALRGDAFLAGDDEIYDIASCIDLANRNGAEARQNPESYVFFVAHMYHMLGTPDAEDPDGSINKQWDFKVQGKDRVFGAFENPSRT
ncbi:hypothetical protein B0T21DRAFT_124691 [Apiosordaria backusii]|uniref:Lysine-specific metallo-endopeptidase domain-containing protein n=1 Tax=Apiosordaria backusii TaxID=314023 RepID=A0AA40K1E7_9PEZI|nr:hypothetical protein B0T21DRAFT_124691 [Apiosordaria backusii]